MKKRKDKVKSLREDAWVDQDTMLRLKREAEHKLREYELIRHGNLRISYEAVIQHIQGLVKAAPRPYAVQLRKLGRELEDLQQQVEAECTELRKQHQVECELDANTIDAI